ncbi:MAG: hypothetical protein K0Q94_5943, partial [Paenibacillus sp.]|nr:hypothetical protein [Paenibacillus sp.]
MDVSLLSLHWVYLAFVLLIIGFMVMRRDTTIVCIIGILALGLLATHSVSHSVGGVFSGFIYAIKELIGTILVISLIVALSRLLIITGINEV